MRTLNDFEIAVSQWDNFRVANFVYDCSHFLSEYDSYTTTIAPSNGSIILELSKRLIPLTFGSRQSPTQIAIGAFHYLAVNYPKRLHSAIMSILNRPNVELSTQVLLRLAQLLVPANPNEAETIAIALHKRLLHFDIAAELKASFSETLVYLCGTKASGAAVQMMLDRLDSSGWGNQLAVEAALRILASTEPTQLPECLQMLEVWLGKNQPQEQIIALIEELGERASSKAYLRAIVSMWPHECPSVYKNTFGRASTLAPFGLNRERYTYNKRDRVIATSGERRFDLTRLAVNAHGHNSYAGWEKSLFDVIGFMPTVISVSSGEHPRSSDPNQSLFRSEQFAAMLQTQPPSEERFN